jgi:ABC-2 type transport system ATP-binding protein
MDPAIRLKGVTKTFGQTKAVDNLDLAIPRGGLYGFIGPNGAGKTTSIRMIMSILFPDSGEISILGHPSALDAKDRIGYLPEERGVYKKMKVAAFLSYMARLKGVGGDDLDERISGFLERVGLPGIERKRCDELSKGMSQKVQFVAAIIHKPDLLILDEPFSGLDPVSMRMLRDLILEEHARGATVLFSTHVMPQAEEICEHVVMVYQGKKVLDDDLASIRSQYDPRALGFDPLDPDADLSPLESLAEVENVVRKGMGYEIRLHEGTDPPSVMRQVMDAVPAARIALSRPRLEDVFIQLVSDRTNLDADERLRTELQDESAKGVGA